MIETPDPPPSLFRLFLRMGGWFVIIAGVVLLMFSIGSHFALQSAKRFEREGVPAVAEVSEKYSRTSSSSEGGNKTTYYLTFTYVTQDGTGYTDTRSVGTSLWNSVEEGDTFELLYLQSAPQTIETSPGSNRTASGAMQVIALVFGGLWLLGLWKVGGWAVAATRARRYGRREVAKVVKVERTGVRINNRPRFRLVWKDAQGREGRSLLHKAAALEGLGYNDEIGIYQGVKHSWWVGDVGERSR